MENENGWFKFITRHCNASIFAGTEGRRLSKNNSQMWTFLSLGLHRPMADEARLLPHHLDCIDQ